MVIREDIGSARADVRSARHGRPKPVGGRFALPSLRFSGAAMAMSTVLGISAATTWLVSAQQQIGRRPGVSDVGASPPLRSPEATTYPAAGPPAGPSAAPGPRALGTPPAPKPSHTPSTHAPSAHASTSPVPAVPLQPAEVIAPPSAPASPSSSPSPSPTGSPTGAPTGTPSAPPSLPPNQVKPTSPTAPPTKPPAETLSGEAVRDLFGPSGTRHTVTLRVGEPLTALQVELRLERPEALPGTTPWSSIPGTVVTVVQERGTLIYRFTVPAGPDIRPGTYSFGVRGARRTPPAGKAARPLETWTASAFDPLHPRALAVRGTFG